MRELRAPLVNFPGLPATITTWKKGDRVRLVQRYLNGTVVDGIVHISPVDGGPRVEVLWDYDEPKGIPGGASRWNPELFRPADTKPEDDPLFFVDSQGHTWMDGKFVQSATVLDSNIPGYPAGTELT